MLCCCLVLLNNSIKTENSVKQKAASFAFARQAACATEKNNETIHLALDWPIYLFVNRNEVDNLFI